MLAHISYKTWASHAVIPNAVTSLELAYGQIIVKVRKSHNVVNMDLIPTLNTAWHAAHM